MEKMICGYWCDGFDGSVVYTSLPPCYKCKITEDFVHVGDECRLGRERTNEY